MIRKKLLSLIRQSGLSRIVDYFRFLIIRIRNYGRNARFRRYHPGVALPPPYTVYESFQMDYAKYYHGGKEDAEWIFTLVKPWIPESSLYILDWGCGPARIIRHLPELTGHGNEYYGTDYNRETIKWCSAHIPDVSFVANELTPPLPFTSDFFHLIYGISVFTHLSEENHIRWCADLFRITRPGGIVLLTTQGDAFLEKLDQPEMERYLAGQLVIRDQSAEGHRTFGAFHPPAKIQEIFSTNGFTILSHLPGSRIHATYISQDIWILQKP